MKIKDQEAIKQTIEVMIPGPFVFRSDKTRQSIDGYSPGSMANFDAAGIGPEEKVMVGRKIAYLKESYVDWVMSRVKKVK